MLNLNENFFSVLIYVLLCSSESKSSEGTRCHPNPCNEGTCIDMKNYYTCICPSDGFIYTGNCVTENCFPNPCKNDGVCIPLAGTTTYECLCAESYNGTNCEIDTRLCHPNPCKNGFPCIINEGKEVCKCQLPYKGNNCEIGPCTKNPCQNGGTCTMYSKVPRCECLSGFYGERCEKDACYLRDVCKNGGTCRLDGYNKLKCVCRPLYYGIFCENEISNTQDTTESERITGTYKISNSPETTEPEEITVTNKVSNTPGTTETEMITVTSKISNLPETKEPEKITVTNGISTTPSDTIELEKTTIINKISNTKKTTEPEKFTVTNKISNSQRTTQPERTTVIYTCDCGRHSLSCDFDHDGSKICNCEAGFAQLKDVCVDCYCGEKSVKCFFGKNLEKKCSCEKGYAQKYEVCKETCRYDVDCSNGGICKLSGSDGFCECHANFSGDRCEVNSACKHLEDTCGEYGGVCIIHEGLPQCVCPPDKKYSEGKCEMICDPSKCVHGRCEILGQSFKCRCFNGFAGKHCDEKSSNKENKELIIICFAVILTMIAITFIGIVCWFIFNSMKNKVLTPTSERVKLMHDIYE